MAILIQVDHDRLSKRSATEGNGFCSEMTDFTPISNLLMDRTSNEGRFVRMEDEGCLVKLYDVHAEDFRINDVIEFVGVYYASQDHSLGEDKEDEAQTDMDDFECDV